MSYVRRLAGIDEPALRLKHLRVSTRYHQGAINAPKHPIQRFGARHIPFDEFDIWQFRDRDSLRPIAHQRTHRYAVARKFTDDRRAVQAGSAGYQDHATLHRVGFLCAMTKGARQRIRYGPEFFPGTESFPVTGTSWQV